MKKKIVGEFINKLKKMSPGEVALAITTKTAKYGFVGLTGAFIMYCSIQNDFKLSSSMAISLKGEGVNVEVTRHDIKDYLEESNRQAILDMADLIVHEQFYKDVDVNSKKDKARFKELYDAYIKENYGDEDTYNKYKEVYKISDEYIQRCMVLNVKQEKKLSEVEKNIKIDNTSFNTEWETNRENYQYIICNIAVFNEEKDAKKFYEKAQKGKPDYLGMDLTVSQIGYDEKVYLSDSRLKYSLVSKYESDVIYTYTSDDYPAILIVTDRKVKKSELKSDIESALKTINAKDRLDNQYNEFQGSLNIKIESSEVNVLK